MFIFFLLATLPTNRAMQIRIGTNQVRDSVFFQEVRNSVLEEEPKVQEVRGSVLRSGGRFGVLEHNPVWFKSSEFSGSLQS